MNTRKLLYSTCLLFASAITMQAQVFWTEDFGTGCNQGNLASSFTGTNGAWSIGSTGTNDAQANTWYVGAMENGNAIGACGTGCGTDATLHLSNVAIPVASLAADQGASYLTGGLCGPPFNICTITHRRAESPIINCTGKTGITLSCGYMEGGDGTTDDGSLMYSPDGGTTWTLLDNMAKTSLGSCAPQGMWTAYSIALPASANNNAFVKIGFNWINNDDVTGDDPSFAIDDITLSTLTTGIDGNAIQQPEITVVENVINIASSVPVKNVRVLDVLGRTIITQAQTNTIDMNAQPVGIYFVEVQIADKQFTKKVFVK